MNSDEFQAKVLDMWAKSQVPLTDVNLQFLSGVTPRQLDRLVESLLKSGAIEVNTGSEPGDYTIPGVRRPASGPTSCEEYVKKRKLIDEAKARILAKRAGEPAPQSEESSDADLEAREVEDLDNDSDDPGVASIVGKAALMASGKALVALDKPLSLLDKPRGKGEKSLAASAALSLLGPVGWLYAGSFREAIPATAAAVAVYTILPSFILAPFTLVGALLSSAVGLTYAWQFNRKKGRTPLFLRGKSDKKNKKNDE